MQSPKITDEQTKQVEALRPESAKLARERRAKLDKILKVTE